MKYTVKIKGKLKGKEIEMSIPVHLEPLVIAEMEAVEQAEHDGIKSIEIVSIEEVGPTVQVSSSTSSEDQLSIPFEEDISDQPHSDSSSTYTPYSQPSTDQNCDATETQQSDDESPYTPYSKIKNHNEAISYHPKFTNGYAPYVTRRIIVDAGTKFK